MHYTLEAFIAAVSEPAVNGLGVKDYTTARANLRMLVEGRAARATDDVLWTQEHAAPCPQPLAKEKHLTRSGIWLFEEDADAPLLLCGGEPNGDGLQGGDAINVDSTWEKLSEAAEQRLAEIEGNDE